MSISGLVRDLSQVFQYRPLQKAVAIYAVIAAVLLAAALATVAPLTILGVFVAALILDPIVEYLLHRFVLHGKIWLHTKWTARFWIRVHYGHHKQPTQEDIILANPWSVAALVAGVVGLTYLFVPGTAFAWAFSAITLFLFYEIVHFSNHLPIEYENSYLRARRTTHALHHYHNEKVNYGICSTVFDRLVGTYVASAAEAERSETVRNLGYDDAIAAKKPLVRIEYEKRHGHT